MDESIRTGESLQQIKTNIRKNVSETPWVPAGRAILRRKGPKLVMDAAEDQRLQLVLVLRRSAGSVMSRDLDGRPTPTLARVRYGFADLHA